MKKSRPIDDTTIEDGIPAEIVTAISAAVMSIFDQPVRVKVIRYRRQPVNPYWHLSARLGR
ncbi:MAG: hypothetical protein H6632_08175 [Anaerolineales bacterium]|nr:hypothetical protein [Anaerolineales bacterium]